MADTADQGRSDYQAHCPRRSRQDTAKQQARPVHPSSGVHPQPTVYRSRLRQSRNCRPSSRKSADGKDPPPNILVAGKYRLLTRIGNGSFGELYRAVGLKHGEEVAVKLECSNVKYPLLPHEARIYEILQGGVGFPRLRHSGTEGVYNVLVLDLLGPTLEDLLNFCARTFSMKTTLMLADQILTRVEYIHDKSFIHRDIKPDNFLMGLGRHRTQVFMIDFGLAKKFYSLRKRVHIEYSENRDLVGTARYASIRAHYAEQSRRDDLESVGYLLLYFQRGRLPWQGIRADSQTQKYEKIAESKASLPLNVLCSGLPIEFYIYLRYCRGLHFADSPDYVYLRQLFKGLFRNQYLLYDYLYDWVDLQREVRALRQTRGGGQRDRDDHGGRKTDRIRNENRDRERDSHRKGNRDSGWQRNRDHERNRQRDHERDGERKRDRQRDGEINQWRIRESVQQRDRDRTHEDKNQKNPCSSRRPKEQLTERRRMPPDEQKVSHFQRRGTSIKGQIQPKLELWRTPRKEDMVEEKKKFHLQPWKIPSEERPERNLRDRCL